MEHISSGHEGMDMPAASCKMNVKYERLNKKTHMINNNNNIKDVV